MITVLDKGPTEPKAPDDKDDAVAAAAYKAAVKEREDWVKAHPEPIEVQMHSVDANQAITADPERYSYVSHDVIVRKPGSLEDRVLVIENWIAAHDAEVDDEYVPPARTEPDPSLKREIE